MKKVLFSLLGLLAACALGSTVIPVAQAQQGLSPLQQPFTLSTLGQRLPTLTFTGPEATCAIVIYNSGGGFTLVPQVASDAQGNSTPSWVTATSVGGGSITSASTFVGSIVGNGTTAFGGVLSALTSGTVTGVESCTAASGAVAIASIGPVTVNTPAPCSTATCATVVYQSTAANLNATVNTPAPCITPSCTSVVFQGTSPWVVGNAAAATASPNGAPTPLALLPVAPCAPTATVMTCQTVTAGVASVTTPAPCATSACATVVYQATAANLNATVNTPAPQPTLATFLYQGVTLACPSTAPAAVNSSYTCVNDSTGNHATLLCTYGVVASATTCAKPTASPPAAGYALTSVLPVLAQEACTNGSTQTITAVNAAPLQCAASPAPAGINPVGINAAGAAAPVICTHGATTSVGNTTAIVVVAAVSLKQVFVCEFDLTIHQVTTAGAYTITVEYGTQATNPCDTGTTTLKTWASVEATLAGLSTLALSAGTGVGQVMPTIPAGNQLCIVSSSANAAMRFSVMYEQF